MKGQDLLRLWGCLVCFISGVTQAYPSPNIVFIMVDDMGWNDVSYHGSDQILTPNIDTLASRAVILQQYYSEAICTPARAALLTGKYPMRLGMHGMPLYNSEDRGIPLTERLLPSHFKELGYSTHLVGKWHVGMSKKQYLPTSRGYDSHYGMRGGFVDYYTYDKVEAWPNGREMFGMDLFDDDIPQDQESRYVVEALTDRATAIISNHNTSRPLFLHLAYNAPHAGNAGGALQPPLNVPTKNHHIAHSDRRLYSEVVSYLDDSVGKVVKALTDTNMLQNTIIVFVSDNGAPTVGQFNNWGVNLPFRGKKQTPWEGGVRVPAFVWHYNIKPRVWQGIMHITDWLPTLVAAAGGHVEGQIDGINQWDSIIQGGNSNRKEVLIAIENSSSNVYAAYRAGDYKIVVGNVSGLTNGYYGADLLLNKAPPPDYFLSIKSSDVSRIFEANGIQLNYDEVRNMREASMIKQLDRVRDLNLCEPTQNRGCLYNIALDPSESHDLWDRGTKIAAFLTSRLRNLWSMQLQRGPLALDSRADPANFDYRWLPWLNDTVITEGDENSTNISGSETLTINENSNRTFDRTMAQVIGCDGVVGFRNFLCLLRNAF